MLRLFLCLKFRNNIVTLDDPISVELFELCGEFIFDSCECLWTH